MIADCRGAIVIVALIVRLDRSIGLTRKRADYVAKGMSASQVAPLSVDLRANI